jgi:uncharacterized protein (TIGR02996 family)
MSQADAFLDAIRDAPDDDAPRLIFADWLDDHGDGDRAAFLRAQVRLARLAPEGPDRLDLEDEADDLLRRHPEWAERLPEVARAWELRRGFLESVTLTGGTFLSYASTLFAAFPLRDVCFVSAGRQVAHLARSPHLARVESLAFRCNPLASGEPPSDRDLRDLFASPHLGRLTALDLSCCGVGWPAMQALLDSPLLARLKRLDLGGNVGIADRAVRHLAQAPAARSLEVLRLGGAAITTVGLLDLFTAPCLTGLTHLDLAGCGSAGRVPTASLAVTAVGKPLPPRLTNLNLNAVLPAQAALALAQSPHVAQLTALHLGGAEAGDALAVALAESPRLAALKVLDLSHDKLGPAGAQALAEVLALAGLAELRLDNNKLRDTGAKALADSPHLKALTTLDLARNGIGGPGLQALVGSPNLARLTTLILSGNFIGFATVEALAHSPHLGRLTRLELGEASLGADSARALAASPNLARLRTLYLKGNRLGDAGVQALAGSPHLARLRALNLDDNGVGKSGAEALAASPHLRRLTALNLHGGNLTDTECDLLRARFGDAVVF